MDPSDIKTYEMTWDDNLATGVEISTSTFTIVAIRQAGVTALTKDNEGLVTGNRRSKLRLNATTATLGDRYEVANKIVTNETPAQTKERSFFVVVENT